MLSSPLQTCRYVKEFQSYKSQISSTVFTRLHCGFILPHVDANTVTDASFRSFVSIRHWLGSSWLHGALQLAAAAAAAYNGIKQFNKNSLLSSNGHYIYNQF
jgi:hypothetical protein